MKKILLFCFGIIASVVLLIIVSVLVIYGSILMAIFHPIKAAKMIMDVISKMQKLIDAKV